MQLKSFKIIFKDLEKLLKTKENFKTLSRVCQQNFQNSLNFLKSKLAPKNLKYHKTKHKISINIKFN